MKAANLKSTINLTFDGQIFNLLFDEEAEILVLEIRNNVKYNASYAAFDLKKNKFINKKIQPTERWWTSMLAVKKGNLVLYQYHDQQNPDLKDIFALDLKKGRQQWLHSQLQLRKTGKDSLLVSKTEGDQILHLQIDLTSGKALPVKDSEFIIEKDKKNIEQPFHYQENSDYFATVSKFLKSNFQIEPVQAIDYLEFKHYIIISYYETMAEEGMLKNSLMVLDEEGKSLLKETISTKMKVIGMESFVIINRQLIMIKDKSTLKGYKL